MAAEANNARLHSRELLNIKSDRDNPYLIQKTTKLEEKPRTFQLKPSSVLADVRAFLPKIAKANDLMEEELKIDPQKYDIEGKEELDGPIIKMDMALVLRDGSSSSDSDTDTSSDDDSGCDSCLSEVNEKNLKISRKDSSNKCLIREVTSDNELNVNADKT